MENVLKQIEDEPTFCCQNCGGGFTRDEMVFDDNGEDLCVDCVMRYYDAPYGDD
jgi:hypothetical protein